MPFAGGQSESVFWGGGAASGLEAETDSATIPVRGRAAGALWGGQVDEVDRICDLAEVCVVSGLRLLVFRRLSAITAAGSINSWRLLLA